jgi:hypothetical protein
MEKLLNEILNVGYQVTLFQNALGTITAKADEICEIEVNEKNIEGEEWKGEPGLVNKKLYGEIITDGKTLNEAIRMLHEKIEISPH